MKQVMLQDTEQFCLIATNRDQQTYQISVYVPKQIAPDEGFPVLYLLDGNAVFGTAVEAVRIQSQRTEKTNVQPAIVVGIGYEIADAFSSRRFYDYTMNPPEIDISSRWKKHPPASAWWCRPFPSFYRRRFKAIFVPSLQYQSTKANHLWSFLRRIICITYVVYEESCLSKLYCW